MSKKMKNNLECQMTLSAAQGNVGDLIIISSTNSVLLRGSRRCENYFHPNYIKINRSGTDCGEG